MSTTTTTTPGRADRLAHDVGERELDVLVVSEPADVRYLTGYTGSNGIAVLGPGRGGVRLFLTDFRYVTQVERQVGAEWDKRMAAQELIGPGLAEHLPAGDGSTLRVGFDDAHISVKQHARLAGLVGDRAELVPAGGMVVALRAVKDASEVERLRAASRLADAALSEIVERGLGGRTERDVAIDLEMAMRRAGADSPSFPPIVASGANGALPHAEPRDVAIEPGTLVTIDWGARLDGYCSDCTRTFAVGEPAGDAREVYELVLRAQETALAAVRAGPTGKEIDAVAREIITAGGHGEHFGHGLGHGVGLEVHEGPVLSRRGETALVPGHVVTVEPGVYVPGRLGVRIEDLVVVTENGADVLTGLPKGLQVVA
ncbi:MAG: aminopeptidase family protein [Solirubrobacterales bacterium]|jgi:Xaa-Pro aminopeptidase|nr:aminopeptidase family protein [Solirubrobacterales bacterium]